MNDSTLSRHVVSMVVGLLLLSACATGTTDGIDVEDPDVGESDIGSFSDFVR